MVSYNLQSNVFLQVYCSGHFGRKIEHFLVLIHFCLPSCIGYKKREKIYLNTVGTRNLKIHVRQENGALSFIWGNNRGVTKDVMFASSHEKTNILLSVMSVFVFLFYDLTKYTTFRILRNC